jgi:hypothetical protein
VHRDALRDLEKGDLAAARKQLGFSMANFYHNFGRGARELRAQEIVAGPPDLIEDEIRAVERDATSSQTLQQALKQPAEPGALNGGPAEPLDNSGVSGGPPSVS